METHTHTHRQKPGSAGLRQRQHLPLCFTATPGFVFWPSALSFFLTLLIPQRTASSFQLPSLNRKVKPQGRLLNSSPGAGGLRWLSQGSVLPEKLHTDAEKTSPQMSNVFDFSDKL